MKYLVFVLVIFIQGCAVSYDCNLGFECQDSMEALEAAQENAGDSERALYEDEDPKPLRGGDKYNKKKHSHNHDFSAGDEGAIIKFGKQNYQSKPVYIPDAPMRIWFSPVKLDEVLVGDYYIYTTVKGGFSVGLGGHSKTVGLGQYGPLDKNNELGFIPVRSGERNKVLPR